MIPNFSPSNYVCTHVNRNGVRVFHIRTEMPTLAFSSLLHENKKSSDKMLPPVGIEPRPLITSDSKSNTILSTLT